MKLKSKDSRILTVSSPEKYLIDWGGKSRSQFQAKVKAFLFSYWRYEVVFEEFPVPRTRLSLDFLNKTRNIAIEVQGQQHGKYVKFFHGASNIAFLQQLKRDNEKQKFCDDFQIKLVEILVGDSINEELFRKLGVEL